MAEAVKAIAPKDPEQAVLFERMCKMFDNAARPDASSQYPEEEQDYRLTLFTEALTSSSVDFGSLDESERSILAKKAWSALDHFSGSARHSAEFSVSQNALYGALVPDGVERVIKRFEISSYPRIAGQKGGAFLSVLHDEADTVSKLSAEDRQRVSEAMKIAYDKFKDHETAYNAVLYVISKNSRWQSLFSLNEEQNHARLELAGQ
ncbi:MAG: hypothetical protein H6861_07040 [Rhodospirillales bacterium]|nr:hypothetical protein [Rhodospirillales bacterium]